MKPTTNEWVQSVLDSTDHLNRAALAPEVAERIVQNAQHRTEKRIVALSLSPQQWLAAASIVTLIGLNVASLLVSPESHQRLASKESIIEQTYFSYW
jgi:hypothetical protein